MFGGKSTGRKYEDEKRMCRNKLRAASEKASLEVTYALNLAPDSVIIMDNAPITRTYVSKCTEVF